MNLHTNELRHDVEKELVPALSAYGIGLLPFFPLEGGLLSGKYAAGHPPPAGSRLARADVGADRFLTETNLRRSAALQAYAQERGHTLLELAFSWLLAQPVVSRVIAGASSAAQIQANVGAGSWKLSVEELAEIDRLSKS